MVRRRVSLDSTDQKSSCEYSGIYISLWSCEDYPTSKEQHGKNLDSAVNFAIKRSLLKLSSNTFGF